MGTSRGQQRLSEPGSKMTPAEVGKRLKAALAEDADDTGDAVSTYWTWSSRAATDRLAKLACSIVGHKGQPKEYKHWAWGTVLQMLCQVGELHQRRSRTGAFHHLRWVQAGNVQVCGGRLRVLEAPERFLSGLGNLSHPQDSSCIFLTMA